MTGRPFLLALDARLATLEALLCQQRAELAAIRAQLAPWLELEEYPREEPSGTTREVSGTQGERDAPALGTSSVSDVGVQPAAPPPSSPPDAAPHEPDRRDEGTGSCSTSPEVAPSPGGVDEGRAVDASPPPSEPKRQKPLVDRLYDVLLEYAMSGEKLPGDIALGARFECSRYSIKSALANLKRRYGIKLVGHKAGRRVILPAEEPPTPTRKESPAPVEVSRETPPAPKPDVAAVREVVERHTKPAPAPFKVGPLPGRRLARPLDREAIEQFVAEKGVTRLPPAYADVSTGQIPEEARDFHRRRHEEQERRRAEELSAEAQRRAQKR